MGIGISSFTEIVGAGPSKHFDILGIKMFDSCEIRIHPTGKAIARFGTKSQGQGHETTYAQILAEELGIPAADIQVEEGDTDTAPYGLGTYASRSTPVAGAAAAVAAERSKTRRGRSPRTCSRRTKRTSSGSPASSWSRARPIAPRRIQEISFAAYTNHPQGMEAGLEAVSATTIRRTSRIPSAATSASSTSTRARARSRCAASWRSMTAATSSIR